MSQNPVPTADLPEDPTNSMDLSPLGLADAPAKEEDQDSIVHPGNS